MSLINSIVNVPIVVAERAKLRENFLTLSITEKIDVSTLFFFFFSYLRDFVN